MFPARVTRAFLQGMTGGALRSGSCSLMQSDIRGWLIPGLALCGVQAELLLLSLETSEWLPPLRAQLHRSVSVPLFRFAAMPEEANNADTPAAPFNSKARLNRSRAPYNKRETPEMDTPTLPPANTAVTQQALLTDMDMDTRVCTLFMRDATRSEVGVEDLPASYSHALILMRAPQRHVRALCINAAIQLWAVFACACPDCVCAINPADATVRALAAEFWQELAGNARSAQATLLRSLAHRFESATRPDDLYDAFALLYRSACASFALPQDVENALLAPTADILTDIERRELIYLCRAGTRDLKVFAARRLSYEQEHADARATLQQLRYDADVWVRGMTGAL